MIPERLAAALAVLLLCVSPVLAQGDKRNAANPVVDDGALATVATEAAPTGSAVDKIRSTKIGSDVSPATSAGSKRTDVPESVSLGTATAEAPASTAGRSDPARLPSETADGRAGELTPARQGEGACENFGGGARKNGVVWCGTEPTLSFKVLAERAAPILWFSPDEQLLKKRYKLPQPIPCDSSHQTVCKSKDKPSFCEADEYCSGHRNNESGVVYYQVRRIERKDGSSELPYAGADGARYLKLDRIEKLSLKYYFYYCLDCGFGGHQHDLENIEFEIVIEKEESGPRYRARVREVIGAAHGVHWYNNRLKLDDDEVKGAVFPITILVEQGKHASAPDKDGGGTYDHGTDINSRRNDAWGIRDKLGWGKWSLTLPLYRKHYTNQKRPTNLLYRIGSKAQIDSHPDVWAGYKVEVSPAEGKTEELGKPEETYVLRELGSDCEQEQARKAANSGGFNLYKVMKNRGAWKPPAVAEPSSKFTRLIRSSFLMEEDDNLPENVWEKLLQFSYRYDQSHGFSLTPPLPTGRLFHGYFVPRAHFTGFSNGSRRYGLDYIYTPSAARFADLYAAGGIEWYRTGPNRPFRFGPAWEVGLKGRVAVPKLPFKLFAGYRFGIRTSPTRKFTFVHEGGGGLF